jgi:hypothetical protein
LVYTKVQAAQTQLETAIWLWFHYKDPLSIHALAVAANEVYHGIGRNLGTPTIVGALRAALDRKDRNVLNHAQNFAKHANRDYADPLEEGVVIPRMAEALIFDCIYCHMKKFGGKTPLMLSFLMRFAAEVPRFMEVFFPDAEEKFSNPSVIEEFLSTSRPEFLKKTLEVLAGPG